ncbi:hypothetical protein M9Y10_013532 [Tritrichomonas musculus]|uniref:Phage head morphogenesis domain-containing protein n=1 Tax=Tritrichomonas musculus TaxID=1915356 RepID=A0ABR2GII9_9EUKA
MLKSLESAYSRALADVKITIKELRQSIKELEVTNAEQSLINSKVYQLEYQELLQSQINVSLDLLRQRNITTITNFLQSMYSDSFLGDVFILQKFHKIPVYVPINVKLIVKAIKTETAGLKFSERLYADVDNLKSQVIAEISRGIAQGNSYAEIARNVSKIAEISFNNAYRIARTEGGRVSTQAQLDSMKASINEGADLLKRWDATLDTRTRQTHLELDGQVVEYNECFKSDVGEVFAPHQFGIAGQDINCRCRLSSIPRWDLDDKSSTRKDNLTGEIIPYKTYQNWKKEYLKIPKIHHKKVGD